ncbi:uncharacterized protein LOC132195701 [Neocloeon triangulifer]|uniref:uncharacterized protein LOC132195701 n=1 Tax=Neocloeon triangulifer TaxID=2078957 RepID=UPI00286F9DFC|nr:uncharacterized protein LOC132195701 [Neocloeon triangulifer]
MWSSLPPMPRRLEESVGRERRKTHWTWSWTRSFEATTPSQKEERGYHPNAADPATVDVARKLCETFGVHFDWSCEQRLVKAAATDPDYYSILNVYRQLRMLHYEEGWDCGKKHVTQLIPPNVSSLIRLRTLLLEERNILAMSLEDLSEVPTYLKGVFTRADLTWNQPDEDYNEVDEDAHPQQNDEGSRESPRITPQEALSLFKQRFFSLLLWPSYMSRFATCLRVKGWLVPVPMKTRTKWTTCSSTLTLTRRTK